MSTGVQVEVNVVQGGQVTARSGHLMEVGNDGLVIRIDDPPPTDSRVELTFPNGNRYPGRVSWARVSRTNPDKTGMGVELDGLSAQEVQAIVEFASEG